MVAVSGARRRRIRSLLLAPRLLDLLKTSTQELHTAAERAPFMAALIRGRISREAYRGLLVNLQAIYAALESELERHRDHPALAAMHLQDIARSAALAADLQLLVADTLPDAGAPLLRPSAAAYATRLHEIGRDDPRLLLAHAYVRYLGDLSGGQILRRIVADKLAAPTAFYEFGTPADAQALAARFRAELAQVPLDAVGIDAVVGEAASGFRRHIALFEELAAEHAID
jgi:heme oxygenase